MNVDFNPEPPDDDPLLAALRRQLGESFGQAPPPQAWASIRQRLAPRPWWRRPRRLLPALALLLTLCAVVSVLVVHRPAAPTTATTRPATGAAGPATTARLRRLAYPAGRQPHNQPATFTSQATTPAAPGSAPIAAREAVAAAGRLADKRTASTASANPDLAADYPAAAAPGASRASAPATAGRIGLTAVGGRSHLPVATRPAMPPDAKAASIALAPVAASRASTASRQHLATLAASATHQHQLRRAVTGEHRPGQTAGAAPASWLPAGATFGHRRRAGRPLAADPAAGAATRRGSRPQPAAGSTSRTGNLPTARPGWRPGRVAGPLVTAASAPTARPSQPLTRPVEVASGATAALDASADATAATTTTTSAAATAPLAAWPAGEALLATYPVPLLLPAIARPATLAPLPDSGRPAPPFRRWAVQLLGGPTLSYRVVPTQLDAPPTVAPPSVVGSLATYRPAYSGYERPALGWGAQLQARRVLSGRWALALGLGYHEYATRLDLQIRQGNDSALLAVHRRDTYRLLTVPLQASYTLGPPRRHLGLALLAGAEPGWYQGGQVTEGADCGCQQQTFTPGTASPYNAWNLALSLGLDLRYRLGGPAGRWQLLAQPTARYVATPFVQTGASYVRRQPYSLGLLAGLAWDWR